jgi:hypothetical protein
LLAFVYIVQIAFLVYSLEIWDMGLYMFEGMRTAITLGAMPYNSLLWATVLNLVCLVLGFLYLHWMLALARRKGYLSRLVQD